MSISNINTRENLKKNNLTFKGITFRNIPQKTQITIQEKILPALQEGNNGIIIDRFVRSSKNNLHFVQDTKHKNGYKMFLVEENGIVSATKDGKKTLVPKRTSKPHSDEKPVSFSFKFLGDNQTMSAAINDRSQKRNIKLNELGYETDIRRNFYKSVDSFLEKLNSIFNVK